MVKTKNARLSAAADLPLKAV